MLWIYEHFAATAISSDPISQAHVCAILDVYKRQERTPHTEHTEIVKNDTDSTCQTKGKTTYFCTLCNQTTRTVEKELADHSYLGGKCR